MSKIKIIELLKSLSQEEMRLLDKFVRSPIHNKHEQVIGLFAYLRKHIQRANEEPYGEKLFRTLFPGEPVNKQKLHHISSYLFQVVEEFLAWHEWKQNQTATRIGLLNAYRRLKQPKLFYKVLDKTLSDHNEEKVKDSLYYDQLFKLENLRFSQMRIDSKNKDFRLQELSDAQDEAFMIQKLKTACILLSNQAVTKKTYQLGLIPYIQEYCETQNFLDNPTLAIYYYATKALSNFQDDHSFQKLKQLLISYRDRFNIAELYDIHIFAINYCIRRLNSGEQRFMREVFDIYQSGLETGIFLEKGMLAPRTYSNIVMSGLRLGEYDAVETFIYDYKDKLPQKQRDGFFNYNLAHLYYEKKNYLEAMPLLLQIDTNDILHACTAKKLLAKMYFELEELESLNSLLNSFRIYIKRKQVLGYHREGYLNFIRFVHDILHLRTNEDKKKLIHKINETRILTEKAWLLDQVGKL